MQVKYCFASLRSQFRLFFSWADLLEYKRTSYMAAALFIVSRMQVTTITCCRHLSRATSSPPDPFKLISSGASVTTPGSKSVSSVRTTATPFPKASLPPLSTASIRWSPFSHHNSVQQNPDRILTQVCIEGAQPEGLEGKLGGDGPELSYLYGREDRFSNSLISYN